MTIKCYSFMLDNNQNIIGSEEVPFELPEPKHGIDRLDEMFEHVEPFLKTNNDNTKLHHICNGLKSYRNKYIIAAYQVEKANIMDGAENAYNQFIEIEEQLFI